MKCVDNLTSTAVNMSNSSSIPQFSSSTKFVKLEQMAEVPSGRIQISILSSLFRSCLCASFVLLFPREV